MFLEKGPHRIGSVYKKAMFRQYTDATFKHQSPRPAWLGFLGPILRAEVDDIIVVQLKNFASRNYSMHPHGVFYKKNAEGKVKHHPFFVHKHTRYDKQGEIPQTDERSIPVIVIGSVIVSTTVPQMDKCQVNCEYFKNNEC